MEVSVRSRSRSSPRKITLDDRTFGIEPNRPVVYQAVVTQLANRRQGTADTLTRGEVSGSTRKMWRQKGTGRARQGARYAPHWKGGGTAFGPHPRSYHRALPKRMRRLAVRSALSEKMASGDVVVVDNLDVGDGRAKTLRSALAALGVVGSVLVIVPERDQPLRRAAGNFTDIFIAEPNGFDLIQVMQADKIIFVGDAAQRVSDLLLARPRAAVTSEESRSEP
ncbi:MAG: 50S ribosomal protein L4 [Chloroflexi bacterium]|nr:50S ribosomal protein L4 [Chloroflexota bacterium]